MRTDAGSLEALTKQNYCSFFKPLLSAALLEHPQSGLGPRLPICPTHAQLTSLIANIAKFVQLLYTQVVSDICAKNCCLDSKWL